ncbi:MAG: zinc ribbon domain-containing protein [Oscillochloris sp.]|nr:zinc ribbon domain-containing protein [Oscillochloris sp.]
MPMYEYACLECRSQFDQLRRMNESDHGVACPHCRSPQIQRRLSTFAAHTRSAGGSAVVAERPTQTAGGCCGGSCGCGSRS